jgi:transcriptional regulator with XRE-family HTH domain
MAHVARKFERFLEIYRPPDGGRWTGAKLASATGGVVHRSYVTNLRKGRIASPGYEKLAAIAKAMGFPPEAWFEEGLPGAESEEPEYATRGLGERTDLLFEVVRNPKTGEPYTSAEVARMSLGVLSEEDVEGIRDGSVPNPRWIACWPWLTRSASIPPTWWTGVTMLRSWTRRSWTPCATIR